MALQDITQAFTWGSGGARLTPEEIARQREIAAALLAQGSDTSPVGHWTQGAARVVDALGGVLKERRANAAETQNGAASQSRIAALLGGMGGQGASAFPEAPVATDVASQRVAQAHAPDAQNAGYIRDGLIKRGLPEHVADAFVMNFQDESGLNPGINEANPTVPGSRGGYGLYQLTGPRRKAYEAFAAQRGVAPSDTDAQLDFMMTELQGPEAKAAKSILSAPDSGSAAAAIVNDFLRPAEAHRASRANRYLSAGASPTQVASLDPAAGMAAEIAPNNRGNVGMPDGSVAQGAFPASPPVPVMAGGTAGALQQGQAQPQGGINPAIIEALSSPYASEQERKIAGLLLGQQMEAQAAQNAPPKYDFMAGKDGAIFRTDSTGNMEQVYGGKPDTFRTLNAEEKASMGLPAEGAYQIGADNKISQIGGSGTTVNIDQKAEGAFDKKLAETQAVTFDTMATEGLNARADMGVISELEGALGSSGTLAGVKGIAAKYGLGGEGMDEIQTATALINRLIPTQRQPGSGSMSDRDVEMFTRSLPSLWNTPGGNQKILRVMKGLTQYKQDQGEIADQVLAGELTRQEARQKLRALKNPLADFDKDTGKPGKAPVVIDGYTIEEVN